MAKRRDTRAFGNSEQTTFPKMGDEFITASLINVSGQRSPYTTPVGRKGPKTDQDPNVGTAAHRSASMIHEANGPACTPVQTISYSNAPEARGTGRGLRTVPSKAGIQDFYSAGYDEGSPIA